MDELVASGFPRQDVRLCEGSRSDDSQLAGSTDRPRDDESIGSTIKHFFSDIFGTEHNDHSRMYAQALAQGNDVLTVLVADDSDIERASIIIERFKPLDIEQQSPVWSGPGEAGQDARRSVPDSMRLPQAMSQQTGSASGSSIQGSSGSMQGGAMQGSAMPDSSAMQGSQQFAPPGGASMPGGDAAGEPMSDTMRELMRGRTRDAQRTGVRVYPRGQRSATLDAGGSPEQDKYFRTHWNINYAGHGHTFEDYAPAYRYGSSMAASEQFRGRQWGDVEPAVRAGWQERNPGSAWGRFKAAIRHGWEGSTF
jgi:hypothetical protein